MISVPLFILVAFIGVGIGILSGLLGIGGGMIMVPLFKLLFGLSPLQATGTSLVAIIPTSFAGLIQHLRQHDMLVALGIAAGVAGAATSSAGVKLAAMSPGWLVMLVAAIVIAYSAIKTLRKAVRAPQKKAGAAAHSVQPAHSPQSVPSTKRQIAWGIPIGLITGLLSGYIGVGGGFIMVPLFASLVGATMRQSTATSLVSITILAIPGAFLQFSLGNAQIMIALAIAIGSIPGAVIGARLSSRINDRALRLAFGAMLFVAAIMLVVDEIA